MADIASMTALKLTLFRNGDENFSGKTTYVNPIKFRSMDPLCDELQRRVNCKSAVRSIFSRNGRNRVTSVAQLQHGGEYVLVGRGCYKKCHYGGIPNRRRNIPKFPRLSEPIKNRWIVPGRVMEAYESEKSGLRVVQIHYNGDERNFPRKILLNKATMNDMEQVLSFIQEKMSFNVAVDGLYSLKGKRIAETSDIVNLGAYVAVERGRKFKNIPYKGSQSYFLSQRSAPVPIQPYTLFKRSQKVRSYPNSKNSIQEVLTSENEGPGDQSRVTSTTLDMSSPYDATPIPCDTKPLEETIEETIKEHRAPVKKQVVAISSKRKQTRNPQAKAKFPVKTKQDPKSEKARIPPAASSERKGEENGASQETKVKSPQIKTQLPPSEPKPKMVRGKVKPVKGMRNKPRDLPRAELKPQQQEPLDNKDAVSVDVFNASGLQREKGQQVAETHDVVYDIPVDMLPAEEITEELTQDDPQEITQVTTKEITQEVEEIDIDTDNNVNFSEEQSEAKRSQDGSSRNSSAKSSLGRPTYVVERAASIIQNLKIKSDEEEGQDENEDKRHSDIANSQFQVEKEESGNCADLDEMHSAALGTEEDENVGKEEPTSEQTDENQPAETDNYKSNFENYSSEELQNVKDEERNGDKGKETDGVSTDDVSCNDAPLTETVDEEAKSSNSEKQATRRIASEDDHHVEGNPSGATEQETNKLNLNTSENTERNSYFS